MKKFKTIYSLWYPGHTPFNNWGEEVVNIMHCDQINEEVEDGLLVIHGGEDISPSLYGEKANKFTFAKDRMGPRDVVEVEAVKKAIKIGMPIFGICRGAQLMCALAGGKLVQHVTRHSSGDHRVRTSSGKQLYTNSVHHQMMYPWYVEHELLAWADSHSDCYVGEDGAAVVFPDFAYDKKEMILREPEVVWFPKERAFCVQGHPEWMDGNIKLAPFMSYIEKEFSERVAHSEITV